MKAKILDTPKSYEMLSLNPNKIEKWEDQRRGTSAKGRWEWWYFDAILDDGTTIVIQDFTKQLKNIQQEGDYPTVQIKITLADGTKYIDQLFYDAEDSQFKNGQCDVVIGPHYFKGDFSDYDIHVEAINGIGATLHLHSLSQPYRPKTGYWEFPNEGTPSDFYTWLCSVPKGKVTGTITINGAEKQVTGSGYHDHQWGSNVYMQLWNHWLWARQGFDDYSLLVFDLTANEKYGSAHFPVVFIQNSDGETIFESDGPAECDIVEEYRDSKSGKFYPRKIKYTFKSGEQQVEYTVEEKEILENTVPAKDMAPVIQKMFASMHLYPSYSRYKATGNLIIKGPKTEIARNGELIYEFMYPGLDYNNGQRITSDQNN
ncbi:hypothetical protein ACZ99_14220 [Lactobacillus sp. ATCC 15578]|nr:hypothetical protein ACZ99_14220 [Lactobacillus sp. ATCC 15578]